MENTNKPKLSVIIPVYKAEKFIERCCVSLFEQTLDNIEYIFVDDCSPDNSVNKIREIVARYPEREPMVKILSHSPNRGVSFSRQQGLEAATGEFVIHCDSDDWVDLDMYESAYKAAIDNDADVVRMGYITEYSNGNSHESRFSSQDFFDDLIFDMSPPTGSVCVGLIRSSLLHENGIKFPLDTNWGEDFCVSISALLVSRKTICLLTCPYHYWQNVESITHTVSKKRAMELSKIGGHVERFLRNKGLYEKYESQLNHLKFQVKSMLLIVKSARDITLWLELYPECHSYIRYYPVPLYQKITALLLLNKGTRWIGFLILKLRDLTFLVR